MSNCEDIQMRFYQSGDEERARKTLAAGPFDYVNGGAGAGETMRVNLEAFQKYPIHPRICRDVTKRDLTVELLGKTISVPFLLAPIGVNSILHSEAEIASAKAAAKLGVPYILQINGRSS